MIVVCAIDHYFVELAGVMLASFEANANLPEAELIIVGDSLTASDRHKLQACVARPLRFIDLPEDILSVIADLPVKARWSRVIYARMFLPDRLFGRLLYLDADTLILNALDWAETIDLQGRVIAACPELDPTSHNRRLGREPTTPYFNSGVMLIDSAAWRQTRMADRIAEAIARGTLAFPDQDALNLACGADFLHLDPVWNVQSRAANFSDAGILHFTHAKPNRADCAHPMRHLFLEMRERTPWAGKPLRSYFRHRLHRMRFSVLSRCRAIWRHITSEHRPSAG